MFFSEDPPVPATIREVDVTDAPVTWRVIETIQHSEAVPKSLRGKPEAILAAMLLGRDWKLGPFEALRQIDVIEGTLSPGAELLLRLYRRAGHTLDVHQATDQAVTITGKRADTGETLKVSYTPGGCGAGRAHHPQRQPESGGPVCPWQSDALGTPHRRNALGPSRNPTSTPPSTRRPRPEPMRWQLLAVIWLIAVVSDHQPHERIRR